jgi:toxin ParE1/3/4
LTLAHVNKTVLAERDLDEIWYHIAVDNLNAADALLDRIDQRCRLLASQPMVGRARPELAPDLRSLAATPYVIFYNPQADGIEVVRVLHGARDVIALADDGGFTS